VAEGHRPGRSEDRATLNRRAWLAVMLP
jgi:hypothetical protein